MTPQNDNTNNDTDHILPTIGDSFAPANSTPATSAITPNDLASLHSAAPNPIQSQPSQNSFKPVSGNSSSVQQATKSSFTPSIADDLDLIEKEWVNKAKLIVAKTKDDPRQQTDALHKFKADYIKKRYNKDVKVSDT